jgi:hypothetical protein
VRLYLLGNRELGWFKIGQSEDVRIRFHHIKGFMPFDVELIDYWKTSHRVWIENQLHKHYRQQRIRAEWFKFTPEEVAGWKAVVRSLPPAPPPRKKRTPKEPKVPYVYLAERIYGERQAKKRAAFRKAALAFKPKSSLNKIHFSQ